MGREATTVGCFRLDRVGLRTLLWAVICLVGAAARGRGQEGVFEEYQVKAVFLFNLASFVTWPPEAFETPETALSLCVLGEDPFESMLEKVVGSETIDGRPIEVKRYASAEESRRCHIVFISASLRKRLPELLRSAERRNELTVGDVGAPPEPPETYTSGVSIDLGGLGLTDHLEGTPDFVFPPMTLAPSQWRQASPKPWRYSAKPTVCESRGAMPSRRPSSESSGSSPSS